MSRQFSSHQEFYPSRGGGTLGADRKAATALVYQDVVAGVASTVAIQGDDGSIIAIQASALNTDNVIFNAATVYVAALGGGMIYVEESDYNLAATWNVSVDIFVQGAGWDAILNYNAGGNCITITGDNVKIRDLKIVIVAGAGAGGTRPNGIFADTRTNLEIFGVWHIGDNTVGDDGSDIRQCGIVFTTVTYSRIGYNRIEDDDRHSIYLVSADYDILMGNTCQGNTVNGIAINSSDHNILTGNTCQGNTVDGIRVDGATNNTFTGNICQGNVSRGIVVSTSGGNILVSNISQGNTLDGVFLVSSNNNTLTGNTCQGNTIHGIFLASANNNTLTGNTCQGNTQHGILLSTGIDNTVSGNSCSGNLLNGILLDAASDGNTLIGNTCQGNTQHGIIVDDSDNNTIVGNTCNENDSGDTGSFDGINITDASLDNQIHSNTCNNNDRYGINIDDVNALRNWVKNNQLRGNTTAPFNDAGTGTKLATIPIQLIQGTTFISAAGNPWGWEIDLATEFALGIGWLPLELQQVVRIRIIGVGLAAPGAGNAMLIELTGEGATFDEVYTTNAIDVANHLSEEINFAINDVINWVFDATDDAQIGTLLGGDRLQIKAIHNVGVATDIATDAIVDSIQVEYV